MDAESTEPYGQGGGMGRAEAVARIEALAESYDDDPGITRGTMFRSPGLAVSGRIFAFAGSGGRIIVKLPRERGGALVEAGDAEPVTMGTRTMREWFAITPSVGDASLGEIADEASGFVSGLDG